MHRGICPTPVVLNAIAWATLPASARLVEWGEEEEVEEEEDLERSASNVIGLGILPVIARRKKITATGVMALVTLPKTVTILLMNHLATIAPKWAILLEIVLKMKGHVMSVTKLDIFPVSVP